jgi:hypothetical protein
VRPVCRRPGCAEDAFYGIGFCFACGVTYLAWRARRDRLEAADLAPGGHPPDAELDDDAAFAEALDLIYLYLFRGPFE